MLREAKWLLLIAVGLYLLLIFATYQRADPGWSHSATDAVVRNAGGAFGAWLADLLLYPLRRVSLLRVGALRLRRGLGIPPHGFAAAGHCLGRLRAGSGSSAALERLRFHSLAAELPLAPGGVLGEVLAANLSAALGFTGATLLLLTFGAIGFSLFIGVSWLAMFEGMGLLLEKTYFAALGVWERRTDRKLGTRAREEREAVVQIEKRREEDHAPLRIEPALAEIKKSERAQKEKQAPLFENLPDTPLPPLKLLDEASGGGVSIAPETLEFTSRLIEKKLSDFGVAVKVLAAYPGPVITRYEIEPAVGVKGSQIVNLVKDLARALSVVSIRVVETIPGKSCMGLEIPNPHRQTVRLDRDPRLRGLSRHAFAARARPRQGHRRPSDRHRPRAHAAPARRRHHRLGQIGRAERDDPVAPLQVGAARRAPDPDRPEDARAFGLRGHPAPARAGRHRHEAGDQRAQLVRGGDGRRYKLMNWIGARNLSGFNHKVADRKVEPSDHPGSAKSRSSFSRCRTSWW